MTDDNDSFEHALGAMRAVDPPSATRSADARRAIVEALSAPSEPVAVRAKSRAFVAGLLLAATLGGSAFAATAVRWARVARVSAAANQAPPSTLASRRALVPSQRPAPARLVAAVVAPPAPSDAVPVVLARESVPRASALVPAARSTAPVRASAPRASAEPPRLALAPQQPTDAPAVEPVRATPVSIVDALYTAAHEAHFTQRDPALALTRWDAYLRESPAGSFAPEAQFNRIVCLVRLGRRADAIAAIRALPESHYRHTEAQRLLERLGSP